VAHGERERSSGTLVARGPALRGVTQLALLRPEGASGDSDAATRDALRDAGPLIAAFRLHFHACGAPHARSNASATNATTNATSGACGAVLRHRRAMAPSAPIEFTARFSDGTRGAAAAVPGSAFDEGFILGVPGVWDRAAPEFNASRIELLEAYASDFPIALLWNDAGLPMEPWSVRVAAGADGLLRWGWQPPEEAANSTAAAADKKAQR
jgi:hypothetical protein